MKTTTCSLVAVLACAFSSAAISAVQKPFGVSERHQPKQVMGREYWTYIGSGPHTDPAYSPGIANWNAPWNNSSLTNLPVFRDCGLVRHSHRLPPSAKGTSASWRTVKDNCGGDQWKILSSDAKQDRPLVVVFDGKRNVLAMAGDVDLDHDDWAAFKKAHPNLVGTRTMCEWGNDMLLLIPRTTNVLNTARRQELEAVWAKHALTNRYDRLALARWYTDRKLKLHYDDMDTFMAFRGMYFLDHIAAAWGAKTLTAETTNTTGGDSEYRWDISGMFIRGAARQFGVPWCWYEANYFNGPGKDGQWLNNSVCNYRNPRGNSRPEGGTSASAQRRCWYYAYLNGANAVEPESWFGQFFTTNTPSGKAELSDRGKNFSDYHDFTAAHPGRGVTYAPVAILTPFAQGYTAQGGAPWGRCEQTDGDYALNALFFTIAPGWERAKGLRAGIQEGNLHNSRFAMMYDVLVPDSPQPKEAFAKALFAYPAAILVGDYPDPSLFEDVLSAYEKAGGRLIRLKPDELPPHNRNTQADMIAGRLKFPSIERTLEALQRDLFPFAVTGDCQFGANKTKNGWWLWVFNNKGVRKFADTFETLDHSKDTEVEVEFAKTAVAPVTELMSGRSVEVKGGKFTFVIPAGDFAVFEIGGNCGDTAGMTFAPNVQPFPVSMAVESNSLVRLDRSQTVAIMCAEGSDAAVEWAEEHFKEWFRFTKTGWLFTSVNAPQVVAAEFPGGSVAGGDEAYELEARPTGIAIRANTLQGVRYALYTLRQTMLPMPRDVRKTEWYAMPAMKVTDAPALKFRGIHIPWHVKSSPVEIEKRVRLSAYLKYNYAIIEPWGAFRSERHPWWGWKEGTMTPGAIRRLVKIGKELGIVLVPQIPAFGHASMGITSPGRHAILDAHGEYAPLFESLNGWNWCLSNPETLKVQFEIIDELMELFDNPPYFHIGCDEAAKPNCPTCLASDYRALVVKHILALHKGLKARGAQTMLWHDMFLKADEARWKGFYANGTDETVKAFESFPRDIVVCDWFYGKKAQDYPSLKHFKEMGFEVLTCPWHNRSGTAAQGIAARELGILGMLVTSWGDGQGKERGKVYADIFAAGAAAAWGTPYEETPLWKWHYDLDLIRNLRDVEHDMHLENHADTGTYND